MMTIDECRAFYAQEVCLSLAEASRTGGSADVGEKETNNSKAGAAAVSI